MKKHILFAACLLVMAGAHATHCNNGLPDSYYPACIPPTVTPPADPTTRASAQSDAQARAAAAAVSGSNSAANASQGQQQGQQQGQSQNNAQRQNVSAGQAVNIQGAQDGSGDRTLILALPGVPPTPPSFVASANMVQTWSPCGPLQRITAEAVYGTHFGVFSNQQVWLGNTEKTEPYLDESGVWRLYLPMGGRWIGHQVLYSGSVPGVASGSSLTIGGAGVNGGGQAGGGVSGGMQRPMTQIQLRLCDVGPIEPVAIKLIRSPIMMPVSRPKAKRRVVKTDPCIASCRVKSTSSLVLGN